MSDFVKEIFSPSLKFEGVANEDKLVKLFCDLYRIDLFKDGLDLILTKTKEKHLNFEVKIIKGWDTNIGCFLTEDQNLYDKTLGKYFHKRLLKIVLRQLSHNLIAHEMAHALEYESGLNLGEEFRTCIGLDMKGREANMLPLRGEIKRLMVDALKSYKPEQFISELFARYFELLSVSRDVHETGDFTTASVMEFFANTTNFIEKIFNPAIRAKIDPEIAEVTSRIASEIRLEAPKQQFQEKVESFHKRSTAGWSKNVKSNSGWQVGWKKFSELEDKK